ncbi:MAG: hypothetical protein IKP46_01850 [Bacteroidales bacterium]|nr:hypothetical protein [Bacteroidales bacterium]
MRNGYKELFAEFLVKTCKYPETEIHTGTYKFSGREFDRVEVSSGGRIIQAFVLMNKEKCDKQEKHSFPFYRTYYQWNDSGYLTPPTCTVAVYREKTDEWEIHSASDLRLEFTSPTFLNYKEAVKRFNKRWDYSGNMKLKKVIRCLSYSSLTFIGSYFITFILSSNGLLPGVVIPMDSAIVSVMAVMILLLILPALIPYIKSFRINSVGLELNQD